MNFKTQSWMREQENRLLSYYEFYYNYQSVVSKGYGGSNILKALKETLMNWRRKYYDEEIRKKTFWYKESENAYRYMSLLKFPSTSSLLNNTYEWIRRTA